MFGRRPVDKEQEVRERQERQSRETATARQQEATERASRFRRQLLEQAQVFRSLLDDPRHKPYVELLQEARRQTRLNLRLLMERRTEPPSAEQIAWYAGRVELITDLLEAPEEIALALADQPQERNGHSGVAG